MSKVENLRQQMAEHGFDPGEIFPDGVIHRFPTWGDSVNETSGAYWHNGNVGWFQDWRSMEKPEIVHGELSEADKAALNGSFTGTNNKVSIEALLKGARRIWDNATDPDGHPYLIKKGITAPAQVKQHDGYLIIPLFGIDGQWNGLQRIDADGRKRFLTGTRKKSSMFGIKGNGTYIICEGFATGVSLHQATGASVAVAFDAGNLLHVAREISKKASPQNVIVAGDDDHTNERNIGAEMAEKAAQDIGCRFILPEFQTPDGKSTTDFNDLHCLEGLDVVKLQVESAKVKKSLEDEIKEFAGLHPLNREVEISRFAKEHGIRKAVIDRILNDKTKTPIHSAIFPGLVDIARNDDNELVFLVLNDDGSLDVVDNIAIEGDTFVPPPRKSMKWAIPKAEKVKSYYDKDTDRILYDDLVAYHRSISELPLEDHYHLLAIWDFHTYHFEKSEYSPYIWLYAIPERGKTRTGKGCMHVAFRGLHVESLRDAYLVRVAENLKSALFIDVMDLWKKAEKAGSDDIILQRFEKGAVVPRVLYPEKGPHRDTVYYDIYGPTIIATNEKVSEILATRAIQIIMPESDREFADDVRPENALELRERLTAFRARNLNSLLPEATKPCRGRLGDILRPLRQTVLMVAPDEEQRFLNLCSEFENQRFETLEDTLEANILQTIIDLEHEIVLCKLLSKIITDKINEGIPEKFHRGQRTITQACKRMGFKAPRSCGQTYIEVDPNLFKKLCLRYLRKSALSALSVQPPKNKEISESTSECSNSEDLFSSAPTKKQVLSANDRNNNDCAERADGADNQRMSEGKNLNEMPEALRGRIDPKLAKEIYG